MNNFGEYQKDFELPLNMENAKRLQVISVVLLLVVTFQAITYTLANNDMYSNDLIRIKLVIIVAGIFVILGLHLLQTKAEFAVKYSNIIINVGAFLIIFFAILNTFYAQDISNDISIYILVLMAVIASSRMDFKSTLWVLILTYLIFAIGMQFFQKNTTYLFSHRFNGALSNVLAFVISRMFYRYSIKDFKDKLEIDQKNKKLEELSERDDLTGLYNKRSIYLHLEEIFEQAKTTNETVYLGILDLDHFKDINDRHGHLYGDDVLKLIAQKILLNVRDIDIVGRYGGDEFIIIFHKIDYELVKTIMERLLLEVKLLEFDMCKLSFSCGIAVWNGESSEKLFERADSFMYEVKKSGKNDIKIEQLKVKMR